MSNNECVLINRLSEKFTFSGADHDITDNVSWSISIRAVIIVNIWDSNLSGKLKENKIIFYAFQMVYQILSYLSVEGNEPPSEVVPHPDTTKEAPSGMDIADDGKVTGAALKKRKA